MTNIAALPDKLYFKIGEVASIAGVKQYVLRYWEDQFSSISPEKNKKNQRVYKRSDVEAVLAVKHLLYDEKYTIKGAKKYLSSKKASDVMPGPDLNEIKYRITKQAEIQKVSAIKKAQAKDIKLFHKYLFQLKLNALDFIKKIENP